MPRDVTGPCQCCLKYFKAAYVPSRRQAYQNVSPQINSNLFVSILIQREQKTGKDGPDGNVLALKASGPELHRQNPDVVKDET